MFSRRLQDIQSRRLQYISSRRFQDMFSRRLQDIFRVTICYLPRRLVDSCRSDGRLARCLEGKRKTAILKTCWRRLQDMSWRPTFVCWESSEPKNKNLSWSFDKSFFAQSVPVIFKKQLLSLKWTLNYAQLIDKNLFILFIINLSYG